MKVKLEDLIELHENIDESSLVFDVGSYEGEYAWLMNQKYNCQVWAFEPCNEFYNKIQTRFKDKPKVVAFNFGFGATEGYCPFYLRGEGSSLYKEWANGERGEDIRVLKMSSFISRLLGSNKPIDVLKLNCEGAEYDILKDLFDSGQILKFREILVQFHKIEDYQHKYAEVENLLKQFFIKKYNFKWQLWKRKSGELKLVRENTLARGLPISTLNPSIIPV